ncbi:GAF and ANTAR domain-containing protein [Nocardioides currus]|nr:GAF and ANTAR domain-containing protein [Nocardioides currus]
MPGDSLGDALAHAATLLLEASSVDDTLDAIVRSAAASVPGADHVGVTLAHADGRMEALAATSDLARELAAVQESIGEGPCTFDPDTAGIVHVPDLWHDERWPAFAEVAAQRGIRSKIGVRLYGDSASQAGLSIYSARPNGLDEESVQIADVFAAQAALAMGKARVIDELHDGLRTRQRIGIALGILMHRYSMSEERAFAFLTRASSHGNVKLRDVAAGVVADFVAGLEQPGGG